MFVGRNENGMVVLKNESGTLINEKVHAMDINQRFMGMTKASLAWSKGKEFMEISK